MVEEDYIARIEQLEKQLREAQEREDHLRGIPERFRKQFDVRDGHQFTGVQILSWLQFQFQIR
jgi:hypothetical protein